MSISSDRTRKSTIFGLFLNRVQTAGDQLALGVKRAGKYEWLTWGQVEADVRRFAMALAEAGIRPADNVAIIAENRYEWILLDLAVQAIDAVSVPLHATLASEQVAAQLQHSRSKFVVCSDAGQVGKIMCGLASVETGLRCLSLERVEPETGWKGAVSLADLTPDAVDDTAWDGLLGGTLESLSADRLATILYTSGTSGRPKGVMLSQGNLASNALGTFPVTGESVDDVKLGFLPLSHIFARTCDLFIWIACGNRLALAESRETVLADCQQVHPTWVNGVPYFFEAVRRRLTANDQDCAPESLASAFGGSVRSCQCGGAPISKQTFEFYWQRGVPVFPGYGLSEASPVITVSAPGRVRHGCVGTPVNGAEVRISPEGEILTRGAHVMLGYWRDRSTTASTIVDDWLRTGDLGELDSDGLLRITGRLRDLIVTTGAKNIVPAFLESRLEEDPLIDQAIILGDGRDFLTALIVPDIERLRGMVGEEQGDVSGRNLCESDEAKAIVGQILRDRLACVSHHEQVGKFALLPRPFSVENGELTAKRSLRRDVIQERYASLIEALYDRNRSGWTGTDDSEAAAPAQRGD